MALVPIVLLRFGMESCISTCSSIEGLASADYEWLQGSVLGTMRLCADIRPEESLSSPAGLYNELKSFGISDLKTCPPGSLFNPSPPANRVIISTQSPCCLLRTLWFWPPALSRLGLLADMHLCWKHAMAHCHRCPTTPRRRVTAPGGLMSGRLPPATLLSARTLFPWLSLDNG